MKKLGFFLLLLVVLIGGGGKYFLSSDAGKGMAIGVNYTAKTLCSCMMVQQRSLEACYDDMIVDSARSIPVVVDKEAGTVRASIFGVLVGTATHVEGRGCFLD